MRNLIILLTSLAAGCAVGPAYERPAALPQNASGAFLAQSRWVDPLAPLPDRWWRLYDDPVLDDLVTRAFSANTDIRVAVANLAKARAIADEARGGRTPATGLDGGASFGKGTSIAGRASGSGSYLSYGGGAAISWEIDLFGRIGSSISAADADVENAQALRDGVRTTIAAETARAYLAGCALAETSALADESIANAEKTFASTSARANAGAGTLLDADRAAVEVEAARAARFDIAGQRQVALLELAALTGQPPGQLPAGATQCQALPQLARPLPVENAGALMKRRPDIRAAERRLAADTARVGVATAELYPQFTLLASGGYAGDRSSARNSLFSFSFGPLFSWSIPNQSIARARVHQADAEAQASLARFDGETLRALKEVEQLLARYIAERDRNAALAEARKRAEAAFDKVGFRHRAGAISFLDVLVAQRELIAARAAFAGSRERLASRQIDVFKALGGGWESEAEADRTRVAANGG